MTSTPHYVRVARALALVTGLAGLSGCGGDPGTDAGPMVVDAGPAPRDAGEASDSGPASMDAGRDAGALAEDAGGPDGGPMDAGAMADAGGADAGLGDGGSDAAVGDAGTASLDAGDICATCVCFVTPDSGPPTPLPACSDIGQTACCAVIGPLFPPNVPA